MIGKTISTYEIMDKLGQGGMGVVYKALDTRLKRTVALKFLPSELTSDEEAKERFIREAQAAAGLDDPNICTIYEVNEAPSGELYIAMSYYEGSTLKDLITQQGQLPLEMAIDYAQQIGRGLASAHKQGIIHRDVKTANIIITRDNVAKILDFGLAKFAGQTQITQAGTTLGTVDFMSPEQAKGEIVDHRSDIWALGIILYNMLAGMTPFRRELMQAVIFAVINDEPVALSEYRDDIPFGLNLIVSKALDKNLQARYQNIEDVIADLETLKTSSSSDVTKLLNATETVQIPTTPSIAVLPFADLSPQKDQEYFCDGLAEELINTLTKIKDLRVVSRTSSFSFKNKEIDVREIARILKVNSILEGSVRKAGERLRITVQLVRIDNEYEVIWSEKYDRDIEDIFAIQDEISLAIVDSLKIQLLGGEKSALKKKATSNQEAYNLYLQGRYFWNRRYEVGTMKAMEYFENAAEKDPAYALPHVGIADTYIVLGYYGFMPFKEAFPNAIAAAEKALQLDPNLGEAHNSLAFCKGVYEWDWKTSEKGYELAVTEAPNDATTRTWYAIILNALSKHSEAVVQASKALELEPLSPIINALVGWIYGIAGQYSQGIGQLNKSLQMDPNLPMGHLWLAQIMIESGESADMAVKHLEIASDGGFAYALGHLGWAYGIAGRREKALKIIDELNKIEKDKYVQPIQRALVYMGIDEIDLAFKHLDKAFKEKDAFLTHLDSFKMFDVLRKDKRFDTLLEKVGLDK